MRLKISKRVCLFFFFNRHRLFLVSILLKKAFCRNDSLKKYGGGGREGSGKRHRSTEENQTIIGRICSL